MVNDPISDFLTRVRNATLVSKSNVEIPHSNFKFELAKLFKDEGYISDVEVKGDGAKKVLNLTIKFYGEVLIAPAGGWRKAPESAFRTT